MPTSVSELYAQKASSPSRFAKAINDRNFIATVLFCVIGLVITAVVMFRFPNLGLIMAQYNQFWSDAKGEHVLRLIKKGPLSGPPDLRVMG
jgi:hypothetical protein